MVSFPSPAANDHNVALIWGLAHQKMELTVQYLTTEEIITAHLRGGDMYLIMAVVDVFTTLKCVCVCETVSHV